MSIIKWLRRTSKQLVPSRQGQTCSCSRLNSQSFEFLNSINALSPCVCHYFRFKTLSQFSFASNPIRYYPNRSSNRRCRLTERKPQFLVRSSHWTIWHVDCNSPSQGGRAGERRGSGLAFCPKQSKFASLYTVRYTATHGSEDMDDLDDLNDL